jgi:hypothetical protein
VSGHWLDGLGTPEEWASIRAEIERVCDLRQEFRREWWIEDDGAGDVQAIRRDTRQLITAPTAVELRVKLLEVKR